MISKTVKGQIVTLEGHRTEDNIPEMYGYCMHETQAAMVQHELALPLNLLYE